SRPAPLVLSVYPATGLSKHDSPSSCTANPRLAPFRAASVMRINRRYVKLVRSLLPPGRGRRLGSCGRGRDFSTGWMNRCGNVEKRNVRKMRPVCLRGACTPPREALVCRLRRVRVATRLKPRPKAVGGSRKSAGVVDESEIGSANERASSGRLFHFHCVVCAPCGSAALPAKRDL